MKRLSDTPLTSAQKQARRLDRLNAIAIANGYKSWRILETALINSTVETVTLVIPEK